MALINAVGNSLSGQSGSGAFAGTDGPVFTTPNIGAASGNSINFGGSPLSTYTSLGSITPVLTFATPGDVVPTITSSGGKYSIIGSVCTFDLFWQGSLAYTTASGQMVITGMPANPNLASFFLVELNSVSFPTLPTLTFQYSAVFTTGGILQLNGQGSGLLSAITTSNFPSGSSTYININGSYLLTTG